MKKGGKQGWSFWLGKNELGRRLIPRDSVMPGCLRYEVLKFFPDDVIFWIGGVGIPEVVGILSINYLPTSNFRPGVLRIAIWYVHISDISWG